ncbi:MAG TPA: ABC transporter ATP-binding protein [Frankiaceae bacterium]|nr:ABC transporter ATP-binding protein [Frankiaceae bacterium]
MLTVDNIDVFYGPVQALRGLSLTVGDGEMVALLGSNGAGKTTTLRAVSGLLPYKNGSITIGGVEVSSLAPHRVVTAGVAHLAQGRELFSELTVTENLRLGHWSRRRHRGDFDERAGRVFDLFPRLKERAHQAAGTMSGGEQQMLAVGRALMSDPKLLLVDEASMGLAPNLVEQLFDALAAVNAAGTSVLVVEQFIGMALRYTQRAYVLAKGAVAIEGMSADLATSEEVVGAYLGHDAEDAQTA